MANRSCVKLDAYSLNGIILIQKDLDNATIVEEKLNKVKKKLEEFSEVDPIRYSDMLQEIEYAREASARWIDNICIISRQISIFFDNLNLK